MDRYETVRNVPLLAVLQSFGLSEWKKRPGKQEHYGRCPLHEAKNNKTSFSFHDDGRFFCFSCNEKGKGAIDLVTKMRRCTVTDAVEYLKSFSGVPVQKPEIKANAVYTGSYHKFFKWPCPWLIERGLTKETCDRFGVGWYSNPSRKSAYANRVMLPVLKFSNGEQVAYIGRRVTDNADEPKYLVPSGFHKSLELFGAWQLVLSGQALPLRVVYVVESPFCVMKFHQLGFPAVSPLGFSLSDAQLDALPRLARGVIYIPDRNKYADSLQYAGKLAQRLWIKFPELPEGVQDPEYLSAEQIRALSR